MPRRERWKPRAGGALPGGPGGRGTLGAAQEPRPRYLVQEPVPAALGRHLLAASAPALPATPGRP